MSDSLPRLSRALVTSPPAGRADIVGFPAPDQLELPPRVVQFGTGALLRGLVDDIIDGANRDGRFGGAIVAIGSTGSGRDATLNAQDGLFTLVVQGVEGSASVRRHRVIGSVQRALSAVTEWGAVLGLAREPAVEVIFSNTTEVGIVYDESDAETRLAVPRSFPAKLTAFLEARATALDYSPALAPVVIPCELIPDNGSRLREIVLRLAAAWELDQRFTEWVERHVVFANTLVDRIVTGDPGPAECERLERLFGYHDAMITVCEPYQLLAIEGDAALDKRLRFTGAGTGAVVVEDITPFRDRKVRILNGAHTTMAAAAILAGFRTVGEAVEDLRFGAFVRRAIFDEIVPTLDASDAEAFGHGVLARFANPFLRHALVDITLHGTAKIRVRVVPSILALPARTGRQADALAFGFAAHLLLRSGRAAGRHAVVEAKLPPDDEARRIQFRWAALRDDSEAALEELARDICADRELWGADLSGHGFAETVAAHLIAITRHGASGAMDLAWTTRPAGLRSDRTFA